MDALSVMQTYPHTEVTDRIIGCALVVQRVLGPGLLESAYQRCLAAEFRYRNIPHECQVCIPLIYRDEVIPISYRLDFVVERQIIVELKAVDSIPPVATAQLLTYLKLTNLPVALLINFNTFPLRTGIKRFVNRTE